MGNSGHSERRTLFHEASELVASKTRAALDAGLKVILCIGETLEQRELGQTSQVCEAQVKAVVDVIKEEVDWRYKVFANKLLSHESDFYYFYRLFHSNIVIAYEPVWAIGTGKVASSAQAQEAHVDIRAYLAKVVSPVVANHMRIIYGGSVSAKNCKELG